MLKGLHLKNFKSWREVDVTLAPITGFFGANSSGKSSLLQALLLMKQTVESSDQQQVLEFGNEKTIINLGSFGDVLAFRNEERLLGLGLTWLQLKESISTVRISSTIRESNGVLSVENIRFSITFLDGQIDYHDSSDATDNTINEHRQKNSGKFYFYVPDNAGWRFPVTAPQEQSFEQELIQISYVGPIRDTPKRAYLWSGSAPSNVGKSGENTVAALLAARAKGTLVGGQPLEVVISKKLQQLGLIHSFRLEELREGTNFFRVLLQLTPESPEVSLTDVGFGVSQLLPVLVLLYYVPEGSTIILEQPELHLHPKVQSGLADILIDAHQTRGVQILLESHSEHLLQRLQCRIAEGSITPEMVKLYFCSLEHGESKLTPLELDEYGNIHNYPKDFFGNRFDEVAAIAEAGIKRRLELVGT
jgi:hypothetical protein